MVVWPRGPSCAVGCVREATSPSPGTEWRSGWGRSQWTLSRSSALADAEALDAPSRAGAGCHRRRSPPAGSGPAGAVPGRPRRAPRRSRSTTRVRWRVPARSTTTFTRPVGRVPKSPVACTWTEVGIRSPLPMTRTSRLVCACATTQDWTGDLLPCWLAGNWGTKVATTSCRPTLPWTGPPSRGQEHGGRTAPGRLALRRARRRPRTRCRPGQGRGRWTPRPSRSRSGRRRTAPGSGSAWSSRASRGPPTGPRSASTASGSDHGRHGFTMRSRMRPTTSHAIAPRPQLNEGVLDVGALAAELLDAVRAGEHAEVDEVGCAQDEVDQRVGLVGVQGDQERTRPPAAARPGRTPATAAGPPVPGSSMPRGRSPSSVA